MYSMAEDKEHATEELIRLEQAAEMIQEMTGWKPTLRTLRNWIYVGKLKAIRLGNRRLFIDPADIRAMRDDLITPNERKKTDVEVQA